MQCNDNIILLLEFLLIEINGNLILTLLILT